MESEREYSPYEGFKSFAKGGALTIEDIVRGLSRQSSLESRPNPGTEPVYEKVEPIYESHPGWKEATGHIRVYDDLPSKAKAYLRRIEEACEIPIAIISVGPEREKTIWLDPLFTDY